MDREGPAGAPPKKELEAAYRELLEALWYAQEVFKTKGDSGREGVRIACHAVIRFIAVRHENPELAAPFASLRQALIDFDRGIIPELMETDPKARVRSRSSQKQHIRVMASAWLEVLVQLGAPLDEAASHVARRVSHWPGLGSQSVTPRTVQNWREQARRSTGPQRQEFDAVWRHVLTLPNPRRAVEQLLVDGPPDVPSSQG